jgi:hypothetical protein
MCAVALRTLSIVPALALTFGVLAQSGTDTRATLICRVQSQDGSLNSITLNVDYEKSMVNGNQARIADTTITWRSRSDQYNLEWIVNRYTGEIHAMVRDSPRDPAPVRHSGTCERATERRF